MVSFWIFIIDPKIYSMQLLSIILSLIASKGCEASFNEQFKAYDTRKELKDSFMEMEMMHQNGRIPLQRNGIVQSFRIAIPTASCTLDLSEFSFHKKKTP
jgi:hypothetical protein